MKGITLVLFVLAVTATATRRTMLFDAVPTTERAADAAAGAYDLCFFTQYYDTTVHFGECLYNKFPPAGCRYAHKANVTVVISPKDDRTSTIYVGAANQQTHLRLCQDFLAMQNETIRGESKEHVVEFMAHFSYDYFPVVGVQCETDGVCEYNFIKVVVTALKDSKQL